MSLRYEKIPKIASAFLLCPFYPFYHAGFYFLNAILVLPELYSVHQMRMSAMIQKSNFFFVLVHEEFVVLFRLLLLLLVIASSHFFHFVRMIVAEIEAHCLQCADVLLFQLFDAFPLALLSSMDLPIHLVSYLEDDLAYAQLDKLHYQYRHACLAETLEVLCAFLVEVAMENNSCLACFFLMVVPMVDTSLLDHALTLHQHV